MTGALDAFKRLNIITAVGMMIYTVAGLTMLGFTADVVATLEQHAWMPFTVTLLAMCFIWLTSGTRDPSYYHPVETAVVSSVVVLMAVYAFVDGFASAVASHDPLATVCMFVVMTVAAAILAR